MSTTNESYTPKKKKYKWGTIVPLIGGMTVGNRMAAGNDPDFFLSYPGFEGNDQHIRKYMPNVPYYQIDTATNKLKEATEEEPEMNDGIDSETFEGVDFISAVCPCAGLSMMNASNKKGSAGARGSDAKQNDWIYKSAEYILGTVKPRVFFGENAPGLYTNTGKGVVEKLKLIAEEFDYTLTLYKTNSIYHGIPQKRERTFYFFWKEKDEVPMFDNYRREHKDLIDYLKEVPKKASMQDVYPGIAEVDNNPYINFIKHKEGADNWRDAAIDARTATNYIVRNKLIDESIEWVEANFEPVEPKAKEKVIKYLNHIKYKVSLKKGWWDGTPHFFDGTINAVIGRTILATVHPEEERGLNIREVLHLMGLPHDFTIPNRAYYNHAAQNVPTCTARDVTFEVLKYIDGELPMLDEKFLKQNNSKGRLDTAVKATKLF
jgi:site-specific DNA-cytosine methylase